MSIFSRKSKVKMNYSGDIVVFSADIKKRLYDRTKKEIDYPGIDYIVQMTVSNDLEKIMAKEGAANIKQMMVDEANRATRRCVQKIDGSLTAFKDVARRAATMEDQYGGFKALVAAESHLMTDCSNAIRNLVKELEYIPEKEWANYSKAKKDYRNYKIKSGVKLAAGGTGVAVSIGGIAAGGFTGGSSLVLGIIGLQRGIVEMYQTVSNLSRTAEEVLDALLKDIYALSQASSREMGAREIGSSVVKSLTGMNSVRTGRGMRDKVSLLKNKKDGLLRNATILTKNLDLQLQNLQKLNAKMRAKELSPSNARKLNAFSRVASNKVMMLLDHCIAYQKRYRNVDTLLRNIAPDIARLNEKNPKAPQIAGRLIELATNLGLTLASGVPDIQGAMSGVNQAKEISQVVCTFAMEVHASGLDIQEISKSHEYA